MCQICQKAHIFVTSAGGGAGAGAVAGRDCLRLPGRTGPGGGAAGDAGDAGREHSRRAAGDPGARRQPTGAPYYQMIRG